jgi:hypothetical protein
LCVYRDYFFNRTFVAARHADCGLVRPVRTNQTHIEKGVVMNIRGIKLIGLVLMALLGLCLAAVSASAEELPLLLPANVTATMTSGKGSILFEAVLIGCEKDSGTFGAESDTLGTFKIKIETCKQAGKPCISLGQTAGSGIIETTGTFHLVRLKESKTHFLVWFLLSPEDNANAVHIECEVAGLLLFWGSLLGLVLVKSELTWELHVEREGGGATVKQKAGQTEFVNNNGETVKVTGLRGKITTGVERVAGWESESNLIHWATDVTIMLP